MACDGCNVAQEYLPDAEGVTFFNIQTVVTVQVVGIIKEYFLSGDAQEATASLQASDYALPFCNLHHPLCSSSFDVQTGKTRRCFDWQGLDQPEFAHYFVKRLITIAMDQQDREREMASSLLSTLYSVVSLAGFVSHAMSGCLQHACQE